MSQNKYLTLINGVRSWFTAITSSSGVIDANKIIATNSNGFIDTTFIRQSCFLLRRTLLSGNQTIFQISDPSLVSSSGRNYVTFPETILLDSGYTLVGNGRVQFNTSGVYSISTSVRVKGNSTILGVTLEIVRRRGGGSLRIRGQEYIYSSAILNTAALAQASIVDIQAGDTMGIEFVLQSTANGFVETEADHSMCEFAAVRIR
jgi:hypothetical protein